MGKSIFSKLRKTFLIFSILIVISIGVTSNYLFQSEFNEYLKNTNLSNMKDVIKEIEDILKLNEYDENSIKRDINRLVNRNGYGVFIEDSNGNTIFRSSIHGVENDFKSNENLYYSEKIDIGNEKGKIYIFLKEDYMNSKESEIFKKSLLKSYVINSLFLIILSLVVSYFFSRSISDPIVKLVKLTDNIEKGNYNIKKTNDRKSFIEVEKLKKSIEDMSNTLYNQDMMRKKFISDITHEIKTPIAIIKSQIEAIEEGIVEFDNESLKTLDEEVDFLNNIFMELKRLTKLDDEDNVNNFEKLRIDRELKNITKGFKILYLKKDMKIVEKYEEVTLKVDKEKFRQIIGNILINSYKYSTKNTNVTIILKKEKGVPVLSIEDQGIGISKEDRKHIFERFYRSEKSRNRKSGGLGIGLTIVKRISDLHGWDIEVESEINRGTKIIIWLNNKECDK